MKIAMIGQKGIPATFGGIERHVEELAGRLAARGHEVFVYCRPYYTDRKLKQYKGVHLVHLPTWRAKNFDAIIHTLLASIHVLFKKTDIIQYHAIGPSTLAFIPRIFKPRARVISTYHCKDYEHQKWGIAAQWYLRFGEWAANKFAHETITVSESLQKISQQKYGRQAHYIPNGTNFYQRPAPDLINALGLAGQDYVLAVGRLVRHKGFHYLIKAYNEIKTDKKLVIVGGSAFTDDYVRELKTLARGNRHIIFTGYLSGRILQELYANAYLLIQPSQHEGMPLVVLEAMGYGRPVLASNIPEHREVLQADSLFFRNKNITDLERKLRQALRQPQYIQSLAQRARARAFRDYNWDRIAVQTEHFFSAVKLS